VKRAFLAVPLLVVAAVASLPRKSQSSRGTAQKMPPPPPFSVVEATIPEMRAAMEQGRTTSRDMVVQYLTRIAMYEDALNAVITV